MNRSFLTLVATTVMAAGLAGCTPDPKETAQTDQQQVATQQQPTDSATSSEQKQSADTPTGGNEEWMNAPKEPSHDEIRAAFHVGSEYMNLPPTAIGGIPMGKYNLPLEQPQLLQLAKALSSATGEIGWKPEDLPPGIFMKKDGTGFIIGYKRKNGELFVSDYQQQQDGSYKSVKQETKQG